MKSVFLSCRLVLISPVVLALWLSGCAAIPVDSASQARADLSQALDARDCRAAVNALEDWVRADPVTAQARLETAFLCLVSDVPVPAFEQSHRFIQDFPSHPDLDYGFYLRAMARYGSWKALHAEGAPAPDARQDTALAREAFILFRELVQRFPDSRYRDEVAGYLVDLREGMAAAEVRQARLQLAQGNARQALARAEYVHEHFATTQALADALALMVEAHRILGHDDAADRARHRLEIRFPDRAIP